MFYYKDKKSFRKIIIIFILLFIFRLKLVVNYSYNFITDENIVNNEIEIYSANIDGSINKDYIFFTVFNNNLYPEIIFLSFQGVQKPLGKNKKIIINDIYINNNKKNYNKVKILEQNKSESIVWAILKNNTENISSVDGKGLINYPTYETEHYRYIECSEKDDIGSVDYYISLKKTINNVLKENSKVKINLSIIDENGEKSTHDVVYRVENVEKKVKYWLALFYYMDIILNH